MGKWAEAGVDTAYRLDTIEQKDGKIHRLGLVNFKSRAAAGNDFGLEFSPGEGFAGFSLSGKQPKNAAVLLTALIEESGNINGTELKRLAKNKYNLSKQKVDNFLKTWPHQNKTGRGNEIVYYPEPVTLFPAA